MKVTTLMKALFVGTALTTGNMVEAQVKRTTTGTRPRTTTSTRPTQQKPTEKRWGCYELRASHIAPTDSVIYYLEGEENNALMALDCQTGAVRTVIPGIKGVYEGARPLFGDVVATGGKLLLQVGNPKRGVYIWEGNSLSTSKRLSGSRKMSSYNGKYVLVYSNPKDGNDYDTGDFLLWDLEQMKCLLRYPCLDADYEYAIYHELDKAVMDTAATLWEPTSMGVWRIPRKGKDVKYQLTGEYIDMLREEAVALGKRSDVEIDVSDVEPVICAADAELLGHAVRNLLDNAARYARTRVKLSCSLEDGRVHIVVSDDGPGIAPEDRERVFDRFVRLEDSRSRKQGSTGLGLAVVRSIVERHGGTVRFEDGELSGATARIVIDEGL